MTVGLGVLFAGVQFALTLWGYDLPAAEAWVPLLVMSLVVGAFEAVFFRGFIQGRLEASFGTVPAVAGAGGLYALYHVGYGMAADEMVFLFGLGVVYAIAFRLAGSVLVLWPLLTPLGALHANLEAGDIELPWASIAGFVDVAVVMAVLVWLAHRHQRRRVTSRRAIAPPAGPSGTGTSTRSRCPDTDARSESPTPGRTAESSAEGVLHRFLNYPCGRGNHRGGCRPCRRSRHPRSGGDSARRWHPAADPGAILDGPAYPAKLADLLGTGRANVRTIWRACEAAASLDSPGYQSSAHSQRGTSESLASHAAGAEPTP